MQEEYVLRIILSACWGGIVGFEREYKSKSAGLRTMMMISIGSCLFTMLSLFIGSPQSHDRIASNILTGIGFLGAGVIFKGANQLNGITTAASIWVVAAVSMGIGGGFYWLAGAAAVLVVLILLALPGVEQWIEKRNQVHLYNFSYQHSASNAQEIDALFRVGLYHRLVMKKIEGATCYCQYEVHASNEKHQQLLASLIQLPQVKSLEYLPS